MRVRSKSFFPGQGDDAAVVGGDWLGGQVMHGARVGAQAKVLLKQAGAFAFKPLPGATHTAEGREKQRGRGLGDRPSSSRSAMPSKRSASMQ